MVSIILYHISYFLLSLRRLEQTFDFVIIGSGAAGLTLANRLSADNKYTVAVIEAGDDGSAVMDRVLIPGLTYTDGVSTPGAPNDWGYWTNTLNRWLHQPRGKILGGSTAVNALYMASPTRAFHLHFRSLYTSF
jgi:choline dehydrogenase